MPLRIFEGRAGTGKTTACLREMEEKCAILIVPEQYSFRMGKMLLSNRPVSGFDGAQVYSFRRLASLLEGEVRGKTMPILSGSERVLLLSHLILKKKDAFCAIQPRVSTATEMGELIAEFKKYRITPSMLWEAAQDMNESLLKRKLSDAALLYEEYEKNEKKDGEDRLDLLAKNILESTLIASSEVYIDQFTGFSPQEMEIIRALLRTAKRVTVVLTMDLSAEPQFELIRKTRKDLAKVAEEEGETVEIVSFTENKKHQKEGALFALEKEYFHYPHQVFDGEASEIEVFEASSRQSEITHVAATITRLLRKGYRYGDIAVVSRETEEYQTEIMTEFERFGIPYFLDKKMPLLHHRVSTALLSALSVIAHGWRYEDMFRYLKCGYSGLTMDQVDRLENYCLATGVRGSAWQRDEAWDMPLDTFAADEYPKKNETELQELDALRRRVCAPLKRFSEALSGEVTLKDASRALFDFIQDLGLDAHLWEEAQAGGRKGEEDAQVYEELLSVLRTLYSLLGEERVTVHHFKDLLQAGLSQKSIGAIPHSLDHVLLSDITRSKGSGAKVIFIIGLCDGTFPKTSAPQGFLSDSNRQMLEQKGIILAPDSRGRAFMEQNLIYAALTAASDKLYLSYPVADAEGKALRPSRIIHRLRQIFPNISINNDIKGVLPEDRVTTAKGTFEPMLGALRREKDGLGVAAEEYKEALSWYQEDPIWKEKVVRATALLDGAVQAAKLSKEEATALYGDHLYTSISKLETYRACPYQYFAKYGLRLRERKLSGMNMADAGSFLHKIIEDFSWAIQEKGIIWKDLSDEKIEQVLTDVLPDIYDRTNAYLLKESPRMAFLLSRLKKAATLSLGIVRDHVAAGMFEPMGYEISFADDGELPPIEIPISGGSVTLRGKIDRADKLETPDGTFFRVVDYKSNRKEFSLSDTYHGLSLQLAVYLSALCENERKKGKNAQPAGMVYFKIKEPIFDQETDLSEEEIKKEIRRKMKMDGLFLKDDEILSAMDLEASGWSQIIPFMRKKDGSFSENKKLATREEFSTLFHHVENTIKEIAEEILEGRIEANPIKGKEGPCRFCKYRDVCGFDEKIDCYRYERKEKLKTDEVWKKLEGGNT